MPTETGSYTLPTRAYNAPTYDHEATKNSGSWSESFSDFPDYRIAGSAWETGGNPFEDFQYDYGGDFAPSQIAEDVPEFYVRPPTIPEFYSGGQRHPMMPLPDLPPNPRCPGFYLGPSMSRLLAGARPGEMEEGMNPLWGDTAPRQLAPMAPPDDPNQVHLLQLIAQMAQLQNENVQLQGDIDDLQQ